MSIQKNGKVVTGTENKFYRWSDELVPEESFTLNADQQALDLTYRVVGLQPNGKIVLVGLENSRLTLHRTLAS